MAKKTAAKETAKSNVKKFEFSKLNEFLTKDVNPEGSLIDVNEFINTKEFISSGIYALDALLSTHLLKGGVPNNKVIGIGGESGVGKTFLALNFASAAQKQGYYIIYLDSENAIDLPLAQKFDCDASKFRIDPIAIIEDLKIYLAKFIKKMKEMKKEGYELPKVLLILDSLGNLASRKEVEDAENANEKSDMTRAKQLKSIFRIVTHELGILGVPLVLTNHTYFTQEMYPREIFSGGTGAIYNASIILMLSKAKLKEDNLMDEQDLGQTGIIVTAKTAKNRLAKPKKIKFEISFNGGANPYKGLEIWCTPENFDAIGIAKGKPVLVDDVDTETGEIKGTKPGIEPVGHNWFIRHLDKSVPFSKLHTAQVFTPAVLEAMAPILENYFKYSSMEELSAIDNEFKDIEKQYDEHGSADEVDGEKLFG